MGFLIPVANPLKKIVNKMRHVGFPIEKLVLFDLSHYNTFDLMQINYCGENRKFI